LSTRARWVGRVHARTRADTGKAYDLPVAFDLPFIVLMSSIYCF
jgi:hypothetical protein